MILEEATFKKYKYWPSALTPHSEKPILAACDNCGKKRETSKSVYRSLCKSCALAGRIVTEETRAKISASEKGKKGMKSKNNSNWRGGLIKCICLQCSKEFKVKPSDIKNNRGKYCSRKCAFKAKEGAGGPLWQGGISFEPYCVKFNNAFKDYIRSKFGYKCFLCPTTQAENGQKLCVHHVNYNKDCGCDGDKTCNFVPLCDSCHGKTNTNRGYWQKIIMKKLHCIIIGWTV